jgi:hypothetical protein
VKTTIENTNESSSCRYVTDSETKTVDYTICLPDRDCQCECIETTVTGNLNMQIELQVEDRQDHLHDHDGHGDDVGYGPPQPST